MKIQPSPHKVVRAAPKVSSRRLANVAGGALSVLVLHRPVTEVSRCLDDGTAEPARSRIQVAQVVVQHPECKFLLSLIVEKRISDRSA